MGTLKETNVGSLRNHLSELLKTVVVVVVTVITGSSVHKEELHRRAAAPGRSPSGPWPLETVEPSWFRPTGQTDNHLPHWDQNQWTPVPQPVGGAGGSAHT